MQALSYFQFNLDIPDFRETTNLNSSLGQWQDLKDAGESKWKEMLSNVEEWCDPLHKTKWDYKNCKMSGMFMTNLSTHS